MSSINSNESNKTKSSKELSTHVNKLDKRIDNIDMRILMFDKRMDNLEKLIIERLPVPALSFQPKEAALTDNDLSEITENRSESNSSIKSINIDPLTPAPPRRKNKDRRNSILLSTEKIPYVPISYQYTAPIPDHAYIKLKDLSLGSAIRFFHDLEEWEAKYMHPLRISTLFSEAVLNILKDDMQQNPSYHSSATSIHSLANSEVKKLLQMHIQPTSVTEFLKKMTYHAKFKLPDNYAPTSDNFEVFYSALLAYIRLFQELFIFMSEFNKKSNIPLLHCKEDGVGLIKTFQNNIPNNFGKLVYDQMRTKKYTKLQDFLNAFYTHVRTQFYEAHLTAKTLVDAFPKTSLAISKENQNRVPFNNHRHSSNKAVLNSMQPSFDYHYEDTLETFDSLDVDEKCNNIPNKFSSTSNETNVSDSTKIFQSDAINNNVSACDDTKADDDDVLAALPPAGKPTAPKVCYRVLFNGECKVSGCPHPHDDISVNKGIHYMLHKLKSMRQYRPNVITKSDTFALIQSQSVSEKFLAFYDFAKGIFRDISFEGIPTPVSTLFDTGALSHSFISSKFVSDNAAILQHYMLPSNKQIFLGDGKTRMQIDCVLQIPVTAIDSLGQACTETISLNVIDTTILVIIGLPDIIKHFYNIFLEMLSSIRSEYHHACQESNQIVTTELNINDEGELMHIECAKNSLRVLNSAMPIVDKNRDDSTSEAPLDFIDHEEIQQIESPWTFKVVEAPEDIETPIPVHFGPVLDILAASRDEIVQQYVELVDTHVSKEFSSAMPIRELLMSEEAMRVFIPKQWEGIKMEPIQLRVKDTIPSSHKPPSRFINPKLLKTAELEYKRLMQYFYAPSTSPIASPLVIAPKATEPFIRFCGDYVYINKHIEIPQEPIPHVKNELDKIAGFPIFVDLDLTNSFHQFKLSPESSEILSVQTPWGLVKPLFLPEGVGPASGYLQKAMRTIFNEYSHWTVVIFDNILVLCNDFKDAYDKCKLIIEKCNEYNVVLKMKKSFLGFREVVYFGYKISKDKYELTDDRIQGIQAMPFPKTTKQMQSFTGSALYFSSFVPHFSTLAAPLYEMQHKKFNWNPSTWKVDYEAAFEALKDAICKCVANYYPNYELDWEVMVDASIHGVGVAVVQLLCTDNGILLPEPIRQPIGFASQKFSQQAKNWPTIEQEAYAIYWGILYFSYYLRGKTFNLKTDHRNLIWMEQSKSPKVIRWITLLQSFKFSITHIPGKRNLVADWLSRIPENSDAEVLLSIITILSPDKVNFTLSQVHGKRVGHHGARRTWNLLNEFFPGHNIPFLKVVEYINSCAVCQKIRLGFQNTIPELVRHIKPPHHKRSVGIDVLKITPEDVNGFTCIIVIICLFTKFVKLYPAKTVDATSLATSIFQYCCAYGLVDEIRSDQGSDLTSEVINKLNQWWGIKHVFALVDVHESNGVERTNYEIIRHLSAIVFDERVKHKWAEPTILPWVEYQLNSTDSSETGVIPFEAKFGSDAQTYFSFPPSLPDSLRTSTFLKLLNDNLRLIQEISTKYQNALIEKRLISNPQKPNSFQKGDLILYQFHGIKDKLNSKFYGPYEVISQRNNTVECRHLIQQNIIQVPINKVKLFIGTYEEGYEAAKRDYDQFVIISISAYRGDPLVRKTCEFEILFENGVTQWQTWSKDLSSNIVFEDYCRSKPELTPLLYTAAIARIRITELNKINISTYISLRDIVYVDMRSYSSTWYSSIGLPNCDRLTYVVPYKYTDWNNDNQTSVLAECKLFDELHTLNSSWVYFWGRNFTIDDSTMTLITPQICIEFPLLLPDDRRQRLLRKFRKL